MKHLDTLAIVKTLAEATGHAHIVLSVPVGADLSGIAGILPDEALESASRSGSAVIGFTGSVDGLLAYDGVERRMSLIPGGTVTLAQQGGTVLTRHQSLGNLVAVDFAPEAPVELAHAA